MAENDQKSIAQPVKHILILLVTLILIAVFEPLQGFFMNLLLFILFVIIYIVTNILLRDILHLIIFGIISLFVFSLFKNKSNDGIIPKLNKEYEKVYTFYNDPSIIKNTYKTELIMHCKRHNIVDTVIINKIKGYVYCDKCRENLIKNLTKVEHIGFYTYSDISFRTVTAICSIHGAYIANTKKHLDGANNCEKCVRMKIKEINDKYRD